LIEPPLRFRITVYNPKDGSLVADDIPIAGEAEVDPAVNAVEKAFAAWKRVTPKARYEILIRFANLIGTHSISQRALLDHVGNTCFEWRIRC
jgi:acyl-CoA reductase-like NAD-dependent aldehyde dehydrogenase